MIDRRDIIQLTKDTTQMADESINNSATSRGREQMTASPSVK